MAFIQANVASNAFEDMIGPKQYAHRAWQANEGMSIRLRDVIYGPRCSQMQKIEAPTPPLEPKTAQRKGPANT
jgi:hypothetical protein